MNEQITEKKNEFLRGDKVLWMVIILTSIFSIFPVYSASSNLEYIVNNGTTTSHVIKHMGFVVLGLGIMRGIGAFKYEHIGKLSSILLGLMIILLIVTMFTGKLSMERVLRDGLKFRERLFLFSHLLLLF